MQTLIERHCEKIQGVISCFDRVVLTGTVPRICYAKGMSTLLHQQNIRIFDYTQWAMPLRKEIRDNAERLAQANDLEIDFIRKKNFRKEQRIKERLQQRGSHPGLVHIFSAMEPCTSYKPWHDKNTGKTFLKHDSGKCLHYYFYFIDTTLGLCYLRVPTWAPFRLQFYFNGHHQLARQLDRKGIGYTQQDNAFLTLDDPARAQELADHLNIKQLHRILDQAASRYCPVIRHFPDRYHWSIMQAEYATDILFRKQEDLQPLYEEWVRTAVHAVKADNVATFLGRKLHGLYQDQLGNDFSTRIQGTRIKHHMGPVAVKMYDKYGLVLRIETTVNDVCFFKHYRSVEHRDGTTSMQQASLRKSIYSLAILQEKLWASNGRYLAFLSAIEEPGSTPRDLEKIARPVRKNGRSYRGFNLFHGDDLNLFHAMIRGEFNIGGLTNKAIRTFLPNTTPQQISRMLQRLRKHGLIKKVGHTFKYYLTKWGRRMIVAALKVREMTLIPLLRGQLNP